MPTLRLPDSDCHDEIRIFIRRPDGSETCMSLDSRHKEIEIADDDMEDDVEILVGFVLPTGKVDGKPSVLKARVTHATPEPITNEHRTDQPAVSSEPANRHVADDTAAEVHRDGEADSDSQAVSETSVEQEIEPEAGHAATETKAAEPASLQVTDHIGIADHLLDAEPPVKAKTNYKPLPRKRNKW